MFDKFNNQAYRDLQNLIAEKNIIKEADKYSFLSNYMGFKSNLNKATKTFGTNISDSRPQTKSSLPRKSKSGIGDPIPPITNNSQTSVEIINSKSPSKFPEIVPTLQNQENKPAEKTWADIEDANKERRDKELQAKREREKWEAENPYDAEVERARKEKKQKDEDSRRTSWEDEQQKRRDWYANPENKQKAIEWDAANPYPEYRPDGRNIIDGAHVVAQQKWRQRRRDAGIMDREETEYREVPKLIKNVKENTIFGGCNTIKNNVKNLIAEKLNKSSRKLSQ